MLRITSHENAGYLAFKLEGRLVGPWVDTLRECWRNFLALNNGRPLQIDLRAVTFVDSAGKALLAEMSGSDAKLIAGDCQMKAWVSEIEHTKKNSQ